jgi:DNA-binding NarL/FixJ family response regulator
VKTPDQFSEKIRVALVEDNGDLRESLEGCIRKSPEIELVGSYGTAEDAIRGLKALAPQIVVIDLLLPGMDGVACTAAVKQILPSCQVLILTSFSDVDTVMRALKAGAIGYLIKSRDAHKIVQSIMELWHGGAPMNALIARKVIESFHSYPTPVREVLTAREDDILHFLSQGQLIKEIAATLGIADATVRFHLRNIYSKLHVNNRTNAILKYLKGKK